MLPLKCSEDFSGLRKSGSQWSRSSQGFKVAPSMSGSAPFTSVDLQSSLIIFLVLHSWKSIAGNGKKSQSIADGCHGGCAGHRPSPIPVAERLISGIVSILLTWRAGAATLGAARKPAKASARRGTNQRHSRRLWRNQFTNAKESQVEESTG